MKIVEFIYDKTIKRPKTLWNNVFVLYPPERIQLQPGKTTKVDMKLSIHPPNQIIFGCTLLSVFCKNGLKLENCFHISADNNTMNLNQPINLPSKLQLELVNRRSNTTFSIRKRQEVGFITSLNEGLDKLKVKYTKH